MVTTTTSDGVQTTDEELPTRHRPVRIRWYRPPEPVGTFVWIHGGAFCQGTLDGPESRAVARGLAEHGLEVIALTPPMVPTVSMPLAGTRLPLPGVRHPVPVESALDALAEIGRRRPGYTLGGASAGACLAAAAAARLTDPRFGPTAHAPSRLVLAYGTFHSALPDPSPALRDRLRGRYRLWQYRPFMVDLMNRNYLGRDALPDDPTALPGGLLAAPLPPTLFVDADRDRIRSSAEAFAEELRTLGTEVEQLVVPLTSHGFLARPNDPAYRRTLVRFAHWLGIDERA